MSRTVDFMFIALITFAANAKISERDGLHLIMAFMEAVSLDPFTFVINFY